MSQRVYIFRDLKSAGCPFTRKHVTTLEKLGDFPMHFHITDFSVGWVAAEVDAWVEERIRRRARPQGNGARPEDVGCRRGGCD
jgi:prophage regulatory protein